MAKTAQLYRMVMTDHICPYGLKSRYLLEKAGYQVEDHHLTTREATDDFKQKYGVETTPQIFIDHYRIGGHDQLREHLGYPPPDEDQPGYRPIIAIFSIAAMIAISLGIGMYGTVLDVRVLEWFVALSMCFLAVQKLQDIESFSTMFLNYDLLARRWVPYSRIYPYAEAAAGVLMAGGILTVLSAPISLFIGTVGAISVFKAVYVEKRELKCACVGGSSNVPLGFVSLTENLMMIAMGLWMGGKMMLS